MNILRFDSETAWIDGAASVWRDRMRRMPEVRICLPAGGTPQKIYAAMVESFEQGWASFRSAEVFNLDEYGGLPPGDQGLCERMLRTQLLDHVDLPVGRFHTFDFGIADAEEMCRAYDRRLGRGIDLMILGLGLNGHLGLNEPGSEVESPTRKMSMEPISSQAAMRFMTKGQPPSWGVTLGMKRIMDSREVFLFAQGALKAPIIRQVVQGEISSRVPATFLRNHPRCFLFIDAEAASMI
jgi:glucosamine-6-phosphate deaminase